MIAVALSPKARAVIQAHRQAGRPTAADRARITSALCARLGSAVLPLETPIHNRLIRSAGQYRSATALGMCVVGSVLFLTRQPAPTLEPTMQLGNTPVLAAHPATTMSSEPAVSSEAPTVEPRLAQIAPRRPSPRVAPAPALDPLAEEVRLLSGATSQLGSGQAGRALLALEEHQRRFSSGVLSDERNAAKARALCTLGRFGEGRAALALLASGTPLAARAKQDCDPTSSRPDAANSPRKSELD
jgi:hypothetical protein